MPTPVIALCRPCAGAHPSKNTDAILSLDIPRPWVSVAKHDTFIEQARNLIVRDILMCDDLQPVTHLLWIDDDMVPPPGAVAKLLAHDLDIVGGLCHGRRPPSFAPILLYRNDTDGYDYRYDYPENQLVEVDATGAAFLLAKKEVFLGIEKAFPTPNEGPFTQSAGHYRGEDCAFCERAKEIGYRIFVDTSIDVGHVGEVSIDARAARLLRTAAPNPYIERPKTPVPGEPVASIVINTYNQKPEYLKKAIESALFQTVPVEVIVVDDGSTDGGLPGTSAHCVTGVFDALADSSEGVRQAIIDGRLQCIYTSHRGCYPALNEGIRHMTAPYFCWLSSDDWYYPNKVEEQIKAMKAAGARASFHGYDCVFENGQRAVKEVGPGVTPEMVKEYLRGGCCINGLTVMIERDLLVEMTEHVRSFDFREPVPCVPFDESLDIVADYALWRDIAERSSWLAIPKTLAHRREHSLNDSVKFANDPVKRQRWIEQDAIVRGRYPQE